MYGWQPTPPKLLTAQVYSQPGGLNEVMGEGA